MDIQSKLGDLIESLKALSFLATSQVCGQFPGSDWDVLWRFACERPLLLCAALAAAAVALLLLAASILKRCIR
jgi:hypothetical protein